MFVSVSRYVDVKWNMWRNWWWSRDMKHESNDNENLLWSSSDFFIFSFWIEIDENWTSISRFMIETVVLDLQNSFCDAFTNILWSIHDTHALKDCTVVKNWNNKQDFLWQDNDKNHLPENLDFKLNWSGWFYFKCLWQKPSSIIVEANWLNVPGENMSGGTWNH